MNNVTNRFLKSIHIEEIDQFDLELTHYKKDLQGKWSYHFLKHSPWDIDSLEHFLASVQRYIDYKLDIIFSYSFTPQVSDALELFSSWFMRRHFIPCPFIACEEDHKIKCKYKSEHEKTKYAATLEDFQLLLNTIYYPFVIEASALEEEKAESEDELELGEEVTVLNESDELPPPPGEEYEPEAPVAVSKAVIDHTQEFHAEWQKNFEKMKQERAMNGNREYKALTIGEINENSGLVDFDGKIFFVNSKKIRNGATLFEFGIGKDAEGIYAKATIQERQKNKLIEYKGFAVGQNVRIQGRVELSKYDQSLFVAINAIDLLGPDPLREDTFAGPKKRIELHAHTKMSVMDGIGTMSGYLALAKNMGHTAFAVTDHGVVQAFPDAQAQGDAYGVKILYGSELYMIDTKPNYIEYPSPISLNAASYCVFDFETTGLSARYDRIIEFGAVKVEKGMITKRIDLLINPGKDVVISKKITEITNITNRQVAHKPTIDAVIDEILDFIGDSILVSHNAQFDMAFLQEALHKLNRPPIKNPVIDTLPLSFFMFPESRAHNLGALARNFEVHYDEVSAHRADYDAEVLSAVWQAMLVILTQENPHVRHMDLASLKASQLVYKHLRPMHVVALAKNEQGLRDLYKLISLSHVEYLADVPKIPRHILEEYRSNLLLGSACDSGEVFKTATTRNEDKLIDVMRFYDYVEIQPPSNYSYQINMGNIESKDVLYRYLKDIVKAAKMAGKLVVATGDAHYENPQDKIYRDVYISAKAVGGINHPLNPYNRDKVAPFDNPDVHYRSTTEMIEEFTKDNLFSEEEAIEYVVTNTHIINDNIQVIKPIQKKLFTPKIENVGQILRDLCFRNAEKVYGDPLPPIISERLEKELNGIIKNEFSVIYYLAYKIVNKANSEGFIVGSRGSVGSSLVATMAEITEVNPLPPHYVCPNCKHSEFETGSEAKTGFDLPDKKCPKCKTLMRGDGQNIPFETFLGFNAEKVPDIDLNFPGDYQSIAHDYTKELLGEKNVFRAGTIETVKDKTAFGYVRGYFERAGMNVNEVPKAKISYLASGCEGVKRTTGQHPGGIIVIPKEYEVYNFTPVQYPADNIDASWLTTHLEYKAIHDNILKLDLLGHVDPMALKMLCDLTNKKVNDIPLNDKKVLSIFHTTKALKLGTNFLQEQNGALGIPEFGTSFVRGLLNETKPKTFNDLIIISGLSHGTDVWAGNAQKLIATGVTDLDGVIGCRDDIMTYLMSKGISGSMSFEIMEAVRKKKGVNEKHEKIMTDHGVPHFYIDSCNKIQYLFPKAHATAYVMMAVRVGYFKVYYPLEYYAVFFTLRSKQYDIKSMTSGAMTMSRKRDELLRARDNRSITPKEEEIEKTLQIAIEMADRGYKILNVDLYKSAATSFTIDYEHNAIIAPFNVIDGLGDNAAQSVIEARKNGEFISLEDLTNRTKLNSQNIEKLKDLGVLDNIPETNQINLFDFS
jgi:DNA polymerase-3 subunit alpha (Gram-positive type)